MNDDIFEIGYNMDLLEHDRTNELQRLKKQLEVAVKYLKKLTHKKDWRLAKEALQQIKELKK